MSITNPQEIANLGQQIYETKYRAEYEKQFPHHFVAIEVESKDAFIDAYPEKAIEKGRKKYPSGYFHLIKIGSAGAFKVSYASNASCNGLFR